MKISMWYFLGLESKTVIKGSRTVVQAKLTDLTIEDLTENTLYSKVLLNFFRVKIYVQEQFFYRFLVMDYLYFNYLKHFQCFVRF